MESLRQLLAAKGNQVYSIRPDAKVIESLQLMAQKDVGALLVMEGDKLVGIVSERDYARKVILQGKSSQDVAVRDIMTPNPITVEPSATVEQCMSLVTRKRIRHLPVCERGAVIGIVSIGDLVKEVIAEQEQTIKQLESYIHT
jgi:CBS domain-containing protein